MPASGPRIKSAPLFWSFHGNGDAYRGTGAGDRCGHRNHSLLRKNRPAARSGTQRQRLSLICPATSRTLGVHPPLPGAGHFAGRREAIAGLRRTAWRRLRRHRPTDRRTTGPGPRPAHKHTPTPPPPPPRPPPAAGAGGCWRPATRIHCHASRAHETARAACLPALQEPQEPPMNPCPASPHRVFNQSAPWVDVNLFPTNLPLQDAVRLHCADLPLAWLSALGAEMGSAQMQEHARLANTHKPQLHTHDRCGQRSDMVEFHPSYHALIGAALRHGLHATAWTRTGAAATHAHTERAAGFMLFTETEPSVLCPVSMSYAVIPALRGNAALWADWHTGLAGTGYDPRLVPYTQKSALTMGMGMTEKQGGSDVRANTTQALADGADAWGPRYRLTGHKWFFSAPMCDAFLVLAQAPGGLSCFFLPRVLPAGEDGAGRINTLRIQRLKDKLGNHANASAEVEFIDAVAWRVGEEGRGVAQILEMGIMTRLDCAL